MKSITVYISFGLALLAFVGMVFAYLNLRAAVDIGYGATTQGNAIMRGWILALIAATLAAATFMVMTALIWSNRRRSVSSPADKSEDP